MRRLFTYMIVAMLVFGALKAMRHHAARQAPAPARWPNGPHPHDGAAGRELAAEARRQAQQAAAEARRAIREAGHEVRQAWREARDEMGRAYQEARDEIRQAYHEALADDGTRLPLPPAPPSPGVVPAREDAEGLPVPIVPGTRVTEAEARPPAPPVRPTPARLASQGRAPSPVAPTCDDPAVCCVRATATMAQDRRAIPGDICATEDRAKADARKVLQVEVAKWLKPDVPASWTPPAGLIQAMIAETKVEPHVSQKGEEFGPTFVATLTGDFSPRRRAELVEAYTHELVQHRLMTLGGSLGFVLICLAAVSGYIRADEATKGYYTNRLRMLAAAGVGAAGVVVYKMMA